MEDKIKELLENVSLIPVLDKAYPNIYPSITFHLYGENGALFGDGDAIEEVVSCQVDIWEKETKTTRGKQTIKNIKQVIREEKYFTYPEFDYNFENDTKIHHSFFYFKILRTEE